MDQKLKSILEQTLRTTEFLANAKPVADGKFLITLTGIYRVSFTTLRDTYYLSLQEGTGASILDLARKIIEHSISIEYMLLKGKEAMAERFQTYLTVQVHDEIEFLKSIGQDPAPLDKSLGLAVADTEKDYLALDKKTRGDKTWAGRNFEGMLDDLSKAKALGEFDSSRLIGAYVWGCRLNHPNPFAVRGYLDQDEHKAADTFYSRLGILMAIACHLRLTTRLIDESRTAVGSDIYPEIAAEILKIQSDLESIED